MTNTPDDTQPSPPTLDDDVTLAFSDGTTMQPMDKPLDLAEDGSRDPDEFIPLSEAVQQINERNHKQRVAEAERNANKVRELFSHSARPNDLRLMPCEDPAHPWHVHIYGPVEQRAGKAPKLEWLMVDDNAPLARVILDELGNNELKVTPL